MIRALSWYLLCCWSVQVLLEEGRCFTYIHAMLKLLREDIGLPLIVDGSMIPLWLMTAPSSLSPQYCISYYIIICVTQSAINI